MLWLAAITEHAGGSIVVPRDVADATKEKVNLTFTATVNDRGELVARTTLFVEPSTAGSKPS